MAREFSSPYLSDLTTEKLGVQCKRCGMQRRYDRLELLRRAGDHCLPDFLRVLAVKEGCQRAAAGKMSDPCGLVYD